jgi:hypothetical protein
MRHILFLIILIVAGAFTWTTIPVNAQISPQSTAFVPGKRLAPGEFSPKMARMRAEVNALDKIFADTRDPFAKPGENSSKLAGKE